MLKIIIALGFVIFSSAAHAATVYVYVNLSGNRLITDHPRSDLHGYKLLKKYGVDDDLGLPYVKSSRPFKPVSSEFDRLIISKARQLDLEPALLKAIVHVESAFNPSALSPKGAKGLMQLMPSTAKRYGVVSREDPVASIEGGGQYMKDLLVLFGQDTRLALAAYNAGENAVVKYNGIPPYPETQDYVEKVIQLRDKYRRNLIGS